jgi:hypothetical protein
MDTILDFIEVSSCRFLVAFRQNRLPLCPSSCASSRNLFCSKLRIDFTYQTIFFFSIHANAGRVIKEKPLIYQWKTTPSAGFTGKAPASSARC